MKKTFVFLVFALFFIFLAGTISAIIETDYYIHEKNVLVRHSFDSASELELRLPKDFAALEINSEYKLEEFSKYFLIKINSTENFSISYITQSMVDKSKDRYSFISRNYLNKMQDVRLVLPESAVLLEEGLVFPEPDLISSDGRSIILEWSDYNEKQIIVDYEFLEDNFIYYLIFGFLILVFLIYLFFEKKKHKKRLKKVQIKNKRELSKERFTENLFEDEKKIVEYLLGKKNNEAWTKEILRDAGITKVKLSRKLRSLEQKEIIKKIPYGNENKIRILKK
ncbi:MAG: hypothetical protein Q8O84_03145 [Nanoarchaeota archaeon]|nr:hypothetical protein [Nanoarchaeota archaeon]